MAVSERLVQLINKLARLVLALTVAGIVSSAIELAIDVDDLPLVLILLLSIVPILVAVAVYSYTNDQAIAVYRSRLLNAIGK